MREFTTAVQQAEDPTGAVVFKLDGRELTAYPPTDGQLAIFMSSFGRHASDHTKVAGAIDFFLTVLDDSSHGYVAERLLDRQRPLSLEVVTEIMRSLVEEWSGRPTKPLSVSTQSPESGGQNSTPPTLPLTSSA